MSAVGLWVRPGVQRTEVARPKAVRRSGEVAPEQGRDRRRIVTVVLVASCLIASVGAWALLAPPELGGKTSYVVTEGVSMLPRYHAQDLVVLRRASSYHVGEVAAYHNGQLHVVVLHRIVAKNGNRYVFKGDNNDFRDTFEPTASEIVGTEMMHVSGAGRIVDEVRRPGVAAVLLGLLWILSFGPAKGSRGTGPVEESVDFVAADGSSDERSA